MKSLSVFLTAAAVALAAGGVQDANGVIITAKTTTTDGKTETHMIQLDANHLRADAGTGSTSQVVIFDGAKQVLDMVNLTDKTYTEMTKEDVDRISAQVSSAMSQMQAAMANVPPERRAQIEAMMKGRMGGAGAATEKPVYKKVGTDHVGKWTCDKYDVYEGGQKTSEICTVAPSALGLTDADFAVTKQMADFFAALMKFAPSAQRQVFTLGSLEHEGYSGIPIRTTHTIMGTTTTMELADITRGNVPDSAFEVPAGLQKKPLPIGGPGRR